ncbi:hypothetical protein M3Y96_01169300 [Aphelenchoides besseyi]|nr:hypothetical protein M3Y96_01169300 [Aphelenchoides besseyi]
MHEYKPKISTTKMLNSTNKPTGLNDPRPISAITFDPSVPAITSTIASPVRSSHAQNPLELLRSLSSIHKLTVELNTNENVDLLLSPNMIIKAIRSVNVLSHLIVGDQLLLINGRAPNSIDEAQRLLNQKAPKRTVVISRMVYKAPISKERAEKIQLRRQPGYIYFVVSITRFHGVRMGLGIDRAGGRKLTVNRTDENTISAHFYMLGDTILDVNEEKMSTSQQFRARIHYFMKRDGYYTTAVERHDSAVSTHNIRQTFDPFVIHDIGKEMANDVRLIAQRELLRYRLCLDKRRNLRGIFVGSEFELAKTQADEMPHDKKQQDCQLQSQHKTRKTTRPSERPSRFEFLDSSSSRRKRQKRKHVAFNTTKNEEQRISSDVQNPVFLQHVNSLNRQGFSRTLTFMPRFFRTGGN